MPPTQIAHSQQNQQSVYQSQQLVYQYVQPNGQAYQPNTQPAVAQTVSTPIMVRFFQMIL